MYNTRLLSTYASGGEGSEDSGRTPRTLHPVFGYRVGYSIRIRESGAGIFVSALCQSLTRRARSPACTLAASHTRVLSLFVLTESPNATALVSRACVAWFGRRTVAQCGLLSFYRSLYRLFFSCPFSPRLASLSRSASESTHLLLAQASLARTRCVDRS